MNYEVFKLQNNITIYNNCINILFFNANKKNIVNIDF